MLVFVVGEVTGDGMQTFSDSLANEDETTRFAAVIFGEPTENQLACGHKGGLFCDIESMGTPGHSAYPWLGKSANELMVQAVSGILEANLGSSEVFGNTTVNIGRIDGGTAANVIPEQAIVKMAIRVAVDPEEGGSDIVRKRIQKILDIIDADALSLQCPQGYGPVACDCVVPGFNTVTVNYGTDNPNLKGGFKRYLYGPGSILVAHGTHENLTVGDLESAVEGYKNLVLHAIRS